MGEKLGIKETEEVHAFLLGTVQSLAKHKADDGKIDMGEWMQTTMSNAPAAVKAFMGMDRIDDEMKDLDAEEKDRLAQMALEMMQALGGLFGLNV